MFDPGFETLTRLKDPTSVVDVFTTFNLAPDLGTELNYGSPGLIHSELLLNR